MQETSLTRYFEFVSIYHPDRLCDYLVSCLLDYCIEKDKFVEFRVECLLFNNILTFIGSIKSKIRHSSQELDIAIKKLLKKLDIEQYSIDLKIDIEQEQTELRDFIGSGIYYGLAYYDSKTDYLPNAYYKTNKLFKYLFYQLGCYLYKAVFFNNECYITITNKFFTIKDASLIKDYFKFVFNNNNYKINFIYKNLKNSIGMTGRKLCMDYYNGLIPNNGGSPWGKDPYNADLTLNLYARKLAIDYVKNNLIISPIKTNLICISKNKATIEFYSSDNTLVHKQNNLSIGQSLLKKLKLDRQIYSKLCENGLIFSKF